MALIYALADPHTGEIRYVGKTLKRLRARISEHLSCARRGIRTYLYHWMRSLGEEPIVIVLREVSECDAGQVEQQVIAELRARGNRLTNLTQGGEGTPGYRLTETARAKIGACHRGRALTAEHREKLRAALLGRGRPHSEETKLKISRANKGRRFSDIHRLHLGEAARRRCARAAR